jgi:D-glycero-D-manno-heptose 1,7-bisphosphate phosphatase
MPAAVFLDRDGVINENRDDYVKCWDEVHFLPGVFAALARLARAPFRIVLVTNQSPIGRGILTRQEVEAINRRLVAEVSVHGGRVDGVYTCPHHPDEGCDCRKPRPGLLLQAARDLDLDLSRSYLVGDAASDVEAALAAGCSPIFVLTGRGQGQQSLLDRQRHARVPVVQGLEEAIDFILAGRRDVDSPGEHTNHTGGGALHGHRT